MTAAAVCFHASGNETCERCGIPLDALTFDESSVQSWSAPVREVVLARFTLPVQYCGVLESFMQFTDVYARDASQILTPTVHWRLLVDRHPAAPYTNLAWIVNPWGSYQPGRVVIKLPPGASVEFIARRNASGGSDSIQQIGGRLTGRYWYDTSYGAIDRKRAAVR